MVDTLLRTRVPRWEELNRAIDERDDMLDFTIQLFDHDRDRALASYFQNALEQFRLVRHISSWRGHIGTMLDFASGYGRLTRLLVHEHLADEVTVSDILEGGMEFQAEQFGVRTILSTTNPENFVAPGKYDLIFVASLFTHLPASTFTAWLRRLAALLTPAGLLVFTVHDDSLAPETFAGGIRFESRSESRVLDVNDYGSTWVTEGYVREQVAAIDVGFACIRMPRALAEWQDVYVISPSPIENATQRRVPTGFVDRLEIREAGVYLRGWATGITEKADRVDVRLGDAVVATTDEFGPRRDVATFVGVDTATDSSWHLTIPHSAIRSFRYEVVTVSTFTREGEERILFLGTLDSLVSYSQREEVRELEQRLAVQSQELASVRHEFAVAAHQRAEREAEIAAMKQSRFWKARDAWFAVKAKF
ncbi:MAG TPA: class I SAM-dependent methyltransferase [Thermoanaerobaculia bacterium]|jgi:SAM-dependent methyltransferase|nr:class I SAM-dependent methyltransferase [Thermoanaerobaculia bacterium]